MTNYEEIEDIVVEALKNNLFDVEALPDNEAAFSRSFVKPIVYISCTGSDFSESELNYLVSQEETITFEAIIRSKTRRGQLGVYSIIKYIGEVIQGKKIKKGFDKIELVRHGYVDGGNNDWNYVITFKTLAHCSANMEDPDSLGDDIYLLKKPDFKEKGNSYSPDYNESYK